MNKFWSDGIRGLAPYVPGEQSKAVGLIKLNTNENPYPPSPQALSAFQQAADADLRLYPDPDSFELKRAIRDVYGVPVEQIFVGNGSDEVLAHAFLGLLKHPLPILFPDITYSFYPVYCALYDIQYATVPLDADMQIRIDDYRQPNGGIVFANPNAPTGIGIPPAEIRRLLAFNTESVVIVDEAYVDFGGESVASLIAEFPNLLVIQTLSKSRSLAGLRVGFAFGQPGLIAALEQVKGCFNSYPLDRFANIGGAAALRDREYFERTCEQVINSREWLRAELSKLGFAVLPSQANFLFAHHPQRDAGQLQAALRARNIMVRYFAKPRIDQFLRITVGTDSECQALITALQEIAG